MLEFYVYLVTLQIKPALAGSCKSWTVAMLAAHVYVYHMESRDEHHDEATQPLRSRINNGTRTRASEYLRLPRKILKNPPNMASLCASISTRCCRPFYNIHVSDITLGTNFVCQARGRYIDPFHDTSCWSQRHA